MKVLAIILAGGKGTRLEPLVAERCKPAVPFGGKFRIIDFVLSNCINSEIRRINVMVQYKSNSLQKHIVEGWSFLSPYLGEYIDVYPPQQRVGEHWYSGTADAVYQNLFTIEEEKPDLVLILSGDHIYKMDYRKMIAEHLENQAALTIASIPTPIKDGSRFGILGINEVGKVIEFQEKPPTPFPIPDDPDQCLASMGIYIFNTESLVQRLVKDAQSQSDHDFGKNIIPAMIHTEPVYAHLFCDEQGNAEYWRDVGTISSFYDSNMDLLLPGSGFTIDDPTWQFRTVQLQNAPARILGNNPNQQINHSYFSNGSVIEGDVIHSILGFNVNVKPEAQVLDSVLFNGVTVGEGATVQRAIVDKGVTIPDGVDIAEIDVDNYGGKRTEDGISVLPKGFQLD